MVSSSVCAGNSGLINTFAPRLSTPPDPHPPRAVCVVPVTYGKGQRVPSLHTRGERTLIRASTAVPSELCLPYRSSAPALGPAWGCRSALCRPPSPHAESEAGGLHAVPKALCPDSELCPLRSEADFWVSFLACKRLPRTELPLAAASMPVVTRRVVSVLVCHHEVAQARGTRQQLGCIWTVSWSPWGPPSSAVDGGPPLAA